MTHEDHVNAGTTFLFPGMPPAIQSVASAPTSVPAPVPAPPPTMAERCTGLLFCHVCGAAVDFEHAGEFCPRCHARRCVSCGDS